MKLKLTIGIFALTMLFACQKDKKVTEKLPPKVENTAKEKLHVQTFSALPELGECSTYIAKNKKDFESEKFIFADDYGNNAYLKINDEMLNVPLEEGNFDPSEYSRNINFHDGKIEMKIEPLELHETDEDFIFQGKITIEYQGKIMTTEIYGKSSC